MSNVPILRKRSDGEFKPVELEFRICPDPEFDENEVEISPPHWEIIDKANGYKMAWGPIDTAPSIHRLFATAAIATQMIPTEVLTATLDAMSIGKPRVVDALAPTGELRGDN